MATYTTPKTDWDSLYAYDFNDFNRIEENILYLYERSGIFKNSISGLGLTTVGYTQTSIGQFAVNTGTALDSTGVYGMNLDTLMYKTTDSWVAGNGNGGKAPGATALAPWLWWYVFLIANPTSGAVDIQFDDNNTGTNISASGYTYKRRIGCLKSYDYSGTTGFYLMYNEGDRMWMGMESTYRESDIHTLAGTSAEQVGLTHTTYGDCIPPLTDVTFTGTIIVGATATDTIFWPYIFGASTTMLATTANYGVNAEHELHCTTNLKIWGQDASGVTIKLIPKGYIDVRGREGQA